MSYIDNEKYKKMKSPKIDGGFSFQFEKDFDKDEIEKLLDLKCKSFALKKDTKINPITNEKAPGFIRFAFKEQENADCGSFVKVIVDYLYGFKAEINSLCEKYDGKLNIYQNIYLTSLKHPYIQLDRETIKKMGELNIMLDTSIDFLEY